jgi:hypothetical protein
MNTQTIKNGTRVTFMIKGMTKELLEGCTKKMTQEDFISKYGNKTCIATGLETYTELGIRDHEYYNVVFDDGFKMIGVSGYHLHDIPWKYGKIKK